MRQFHLPRFVKLWGSPAIVIPALLVWGIWGGDFARYLLFTHHLFWFVSIMTLIYPVGELLFPDSKTKQKTTGRTQPQKRARPPKHVKGSSPQTSSPTEHLTSLKKQKDAVDQELAQLQSKRK